MFGYSFGPSVDSLSRPNDAAKIRLVAALRLGQDDDWASPDDICHWKVSPGSLIKLLLASPALETETITAAETACTIYTTPLSVITTPLLPADLVQFGDIASVSAEALNMEDAMGVFAALDVSQEETAICVVGQDGSILAEAKVPTCPDAIVRWLAERSFSLERVGMETGPLAVWLWNGLTEREVLIVCIDARHANGVLKMMPNKTDKHDARGLSQIIRTGWFNAVQIKKP